MTSFKKELIEGVLEVSEETKLTVKECVVQALELLEKENGNETLS